jgi:transposase
MVKPLSQDLRDQVVRAVDEGATRREAADRFGLSAASAVRWSARKRDVGSSAAKPVGGDRRSKHIERHAEAIVALVRETPDATLAEIQAGLAARGVQVSASSLWRFFERHQITLKKRLRMPPSRSGRTS